jgi:hypothetical protein
MGIFDKLGQRIFKHPPKSAQQLSRNDPCWCGSGKKYKSCHFDKDRKYFQARGSAFKPRA